MRRLTDTKPTSSRIVDTKPSNLIMADIKPSNLSNLSLSVPLQLSVEIIQQGQYMGIPGLTYPVEMTIIQAEIP